MIQVKSKRKIWLAVTVCLVLLLFLFGQVKATNAEEPVAVTEQTPVDEQTTTNTQGQNQVVTSQGVFDAKFVNGVLKFSEDSISYLPYIRYAADRILVDNPVAKAGLMFSGKSIEVNAPTQGLQVIFATDTVRINSEMEKAIILGGGNVTIDSHITSGLVIFAGSDVVISENAVIDGDIVCYAGSKLEVKGQVKGSVMGATPTVNITGKVDNDVRVNVSQMTVSSKEAIGKNVFVETYNKDIAIKEMFPNAQVVVLEKTKANSNMANIILSAITTCLVFTLMYILIQRNNKGAWLQKTTNKIKSNALFMLLSGVIILLAIPLIVSILVLFAVAGLSVVAIPALIFYAAFLIIVGMLSTFIVGCLVFSYMKERYLKDNSVGYDIVGAFVTFLTLYVLARVPYIGGFVSVALVMIACGIVFTMLCKKAKKS